MAEHRVVFDFEIDFSNGGGIQGQGFRLDIEGDSITDEALAAYIAHDLRLLMVGETRILKKSIIQEAHKRKGPTTQRGTPAKVRTCLWFEKGGYEAACFYTGLIPNSALETDALDGPEPVVVAFSLGGVPYQILNGGSHYRQTPAASIVVVTRDQPETDNLWSAFVANGGAEGRCGWLTDRWGVSWQIVPEVLPRLLGATDRAAAERAQAAMMQMGKIDIAALEAAFNGN